MKPFDPLGTYVSGTSALHRAGAGWKLAALGAFGAALVVARGPVWALLFLALALLALVSTGVPLRRVGRPLRAVAVIAVLLGAFQMWQRTWPVAVEVSAELLALVIAATAVSVSTRTDDLLAVIDRLLGPVLRLPGLKRTGVSAQQVAIALALAIRTVPTILLLVHETRQAARARGLQRSVRAIVVPAVLRTVAHARRSGEALVARGLGD